MALCELIMLLGLSMSFMGSFPELLTLLDLCKKGCWTYPCTLLSYRVSHKYVRRQEKHKCIRKEGAFCCGYSGGRLGRFLRWASSLVLNAFTSKDVTTSAGRSFHIFSPIWLKVNLRRLSLDRSFRRFSGYPRTLGVSAVLEKSRH